MKQYIIAFSTPGYMQPPQVVGPYTTGADARADFERAKLDCGARLDAQLDRDAFVVLLHAPWSPAMAAEYAKEGRGLTDHDVRGKVAQ